MILHFERFNCSSLFIKVEKNEDIKGPPPVKKKTETLLERKGKSLVKTADEMQLSPFGAYEGIEGKRGPSKASKSDMRKSESLSKWSAKIKVIYYIYLI